MTTAQKRKTIEKIQKVEGEIAALEDVRFKLAQAEEASVSISSGSGSRSYTRADLGKLTSAIAVLKVQLRNLRKLLSGGSQALGRAIYTVYI